MKGRCLLCILLQDLYNSLKINSLKRETAAGKALALPAAAIGVQLLHDEVGLAHNARFAHHVRFGHHARLAHNHRSQRRRNGHFITIDAV